MFMHSYRRRLLRAQLIVQISSVEAECLQFSMESFPGQISVADKSWKPIPDDWSVDSETSVALS